MSKLAEMTNPGGNTWEHGGNTAVMQIRHRDDDTSVENDDMSAETVMAEQVMYRWRR